ncbi:MCE family protein [Sulfurimonas aquatica]|uniref:MCE family protein n=2 Tax=Sulfurimonas aquatica TaxID=2672570 RepID=A0A975GDU7_9BACT|nr:MCE family protein [Sulfurimonas aquatica]
MLGFTYWMLKPTVDSQVQKYTIYFDESVLGLNIDAPVKYRGISVGKVSKLMINPNNSEQVEVRVTILKNTPIKANTVAKLTAQGITGLTYINLSMGDKSTELLKAKDNEKYPVIKTEASFFENFEKSFGSVSSRLSSTLGRTEELLGADNQEQMALLLKRTANVMSKVELLLDDKTIKHIQNSAQNMDSFTKKLDYMMPNIENFIQTSEAWEDKVEKSLGSISESYLVIRSSMDEIKRAVSSGEFNLKDITADIVPTMNATFLEMQEAMIKLEDMLKQYEKNPSDVLFKTQEITKAPGER